MPLHLKSWESTMLRLLNYHPWTSKPVLVNCLECLFTEDWKLHELLNFDLSALGVRQFSTDFGHLDLVLNFAPVSDFLKDTVLKPLLLCSPLGFASSKHCRALSQSAHPFQSGQTFEKKQKNFPLHLKSELLWLTWPPCCGCWWGGRPPPACCTPSPSAAASLQAGTSSPWSLLF